MKNLMKISAVLFLFIALSFVPNKEKTVIILDAGHGGFDKGAEHSNIIEKDYTLEIAKQIIATNTNENIQFILLRESDEHIQLQDRVAKVNEIQPDLVISLHLNNSQNETMNGLEIFVSPENAKFEDSKVYAEKLMTSFESSPLEKRGVKEQRFKIIRESESPALLFELGFVSNENDRSYLASDEGKSEIVSKILEFANNL